MGNENVKAILLPVLEKALKELSKEYWEVKEFIDIMVENDHHSKHPPTKSEQKKFDELEHQANDYLDAIAEMKAIIEQVKKR